MNALRVLAVVSYVIAALFAFGALVDQSVPRAIGFVAIGLALAELASVAIWPERR